MILHRLVGLSLVAVVLALVPAAHASPPDQSWIPGLYDNADFDDVVLLITGNLGVIEPSIVSSLRPVAPVVGLAAPMHAESQPLPPPSFTLNRSPPLVSTFPPFVGPVTAGSTKV